MSEVVRTVAFVLSSLKFGGGERVALNLAAAFKANGIAVVFLLMSREGEFLAEAEREFEVVDLRCDRTWKLPGRLLAWIRRRRPTVVISSFWKLNLCACVARLAFAGFKLILWEHSPPSRSRNSPTWLYAITASVLYRVSTRIVAVSSGVRLDVQRITLGLDRKVVTIFNPIPSPGVLRSDPSFSRRRKRIVWVGRMDDPKNPGLLLEAFACLPRDVACDLDFVGDGRMRAALELRSRALNLTGEIHFHGFQPDPYRLMAAADLLVLSSDREGLPSVLVEALYCGLSIVSTDCGEGIHDILLDGRLGSIVPSNDKVAMAAAIQRELTVPRERSAQIEAAQRFQPSMIAAQFLSLIEEDERR